MNAGPEARHEYDDKNEQDGISARPPSTTGAEQRVEIPPLTSGESEEAGALPAPSGIISLCVVAGRHQRPADPVQLTRALGLNPAAPVTETQILLAAKELGLKAKCARTSWEALPRRSLPVIAELTTGEFVVLLRSDPDGQILVGDPRKPRPERMGRAQLEAIGTGRIVLVNRGFGSITRTVPSISSGSSRRSGSTGRSLGRSWRHPSSSSSSAWRRRSLHRS